MDFQDFLDTLRDYLPVLVALGILVIGWLLAVILSALLRALFKRSKLGDRIATILSGEDEADRPDVAKWFSRAVYYLILLFVIVAFLQYLNLSAVAEPIQELLDQILAFVPRILWGGALLLVAWIVASGLRFTIVRALNIAKIDERLASLADVDAPERVTLSTTLGNVIYWLVFLFFLPAILGALELQGLTSPVQGMVDEILGFLPNLLGAALILLIGWVLARIIRQIVTNLVSGVGVDRVGDQAGVTAALGGQKLSTVIGTIVYVLILITVAISALNTLQIDAISDPASDMLSTLLTALPAIFGAILLIGIAYFVAKWVGDFVSNTLTGIGFNNVLTWLGLEAATGEGRQTPSQVVGYLSTVAIMLFAIIEAADLIGFTIVAELISQVLVAAGGVVVGLIIFGLGLYLAGLADRVIRSAAGSQANILAPAARIVIIVFSGALALDEIGIAEDIVNTTFALLVGAIAVAAALAFGLGARDLAGRELERWYKGVQKTRNK